MRLRLPHALAAFACLGASVLAGAAPLPGKNLDFRAWTADGNAEGWIVNAEPGYVVSSDCAGAPWGLPCALKIVGSPGPRGRQRLEQSVAPGLSLGKRALLTGWIRTEGAPMGASLWLRSVDAQGGTLEIDDMAASRPVKGTTDWMRFSVAVPVAANAYSLGYGVTLAGAGSAWFADLRLTSIDPIAAPGGPATELPAHRRP